MPPHHRLPQLGALLLTLLTAQVATGMVCISRPDDDPFSRAEIVLEGVVLEAPPESPARVKVLRYLKGSGPSEVQVSTGARRTDDGLVQMIVGGGIEAKRGEKWLIFSHGVYDGVLGTSICSGSHRLTEHESVE